MACIYTESDTAPVAEIRVVGRVTEHDMDQIIPKLEAFILRHGKIRVVEVIERFEGFDATTILDGMKFDIKHLKDVSHAAVVSDIPWVGFMTSSFAMVAPLVVRAFSLDDIEQAREWAATAE
jgi:hypothetical protein